MSVTVIVYSTLVRAPEKTQKRPLTARPSTTLTMSSMLFGVKNQSWVGRKKSVIDLVKDDVAELEPSLGSADKQRLDEHLSSVRDLERAIASRAFTAARSVALYAQT